MYVISLSLSWSIEAVRGCNLRQIVFYFFMLTLITYLGGLNTYIILNGSKFTIFEIIKMV